ncbi:MAG: tetratricopeptide repeat protein [Verrucomicrobia bacterium]|nr:tetratricopeptide repeat protein [Verrucomicrobiota bacterium]
MNRRTTVVVEVTLMLLTVAAYFPVFDCDFVGFNDGGYVTENEWVKAGITREGVKNAFTEPVSALIYPLTMLSHMLDCELFGLNPAAHHGTSVLLHGLNVVLLFFLLRTLTKNTLPSAAAAALFAVHPLNVEAVAWISQRKSVLSTFFGLLALMAYVRYASRPRLRTYLLIIVLLVLSLVSKAMLVTFPLLVLLLDIWPLQRVIWVEEDGGVKWLKTIMAPANRRLLTEKIPLFLVILPVCALTVWTQHDAGFMGGSGNISIPTRIALVLSNYFFYLFKFFAPLRLGALYSITGAPVPAWETVSGVIVLLACTDLALKRVRKQPWLAAGWGWYIAALLPVCGLLQAGLAGKADRFAYIPMIGLLMAVIWAGRDLLHGRIKDVRALRGTGSVAFILVLVLLTAGTRLQLRHWADSKAFFARAADVTERNDIAHVNLGLIFSAEGDYHAALNHFREAALIHPSDPDLQLNVGSCLTLLGRHAEALPHYEAAVRLRPDDAVIGYNLGLCLQANGEKSAALEAMQGALELAVEQGMVDLAREIRVALSRVSR